MIIFNGKRKAQEIEESVKNKLHKKGITPKLVSLVIGNENGALEYQKMKKKAGEWVGIEVEIREFKKEASVMKLKNEIEKLNSDKDVHGIMIQLPLPHHFTQEDKINLIHSIATKKDVDGMREDSLFVTPVVKAMMIALEESNVSNTSSIAVIGAKGFEGKKLVKELRKMDYSVIEVDKETLNMKDVQTADVVMSIAGASNFITADMVKEGVVAIDAGAPKGDFDFETVSKKASFITPVPGGIGPITIACLMANML